jgi:hypothetical protein
MKAQIANLVCKPEEYSEDDFASRNLTRLRVCPGAPGLTTPIRSGHNKFQVDTDIMEELQIGDDDDTVSDQRTFVEDDDNLSLLTRQRAKLFEDFMAAETERMKKRERDKVLKNEEVVRCSALAAKAQEHLYVCMYVCCSTFCRVIETQLHSTFFGVEIMLILNLEYDPTTLNCFHSRHIDHKTCMLEVKF